MEGTVMKIVGIRADGGPAIGMGHIMRCLSLAVEFRKQGCKVYFLSRLEYGIQKIEEEGFEVLPLSYRYSGGAEKFHYGETSALQQEAVEIINAVKKHEIDLLFIDTYNVTEKYLLQIKPHVKKLGYIDDLNGFVYPVDILVNGNIGAKYINYIRYSADEVMLLGPKYNLIRREFHNLPERKVNEKVREIMVTTGGTDPYSMSSKILNILLSDKEFRSLKINVIVGNSFDNKNELRRISCLNSNVTLHENIKKISSIMLASDIAISAGGSTLYELCACGTPTLAFSMADNQRDIVEAMDREGYIVSLGRYDEVTGERLINEFKKLYNDFEKRLKLRKKSQSMVDGNGARRVVSEVLTGF